MVVVVKRPCGGESGTCQCEIGVVPNQSPWLSVTSAMMGGEPDIYI